MRQPDPSRHAAARAADRPAGRTEPSVLAAIALGGALGAPARYGLAQAVDVAPGSFPWATFLTNVTGSFALGLVLAVVLERFPPTRDTPTVLLGTGFCGAYTTISTHTFETIRLLEDGARSEAARNALGTLTVGAVAAATGLTLAAL